MDVVLKDTRNRMEKALESLEKDLSRLRTGRASAALLEGIQVEYYGTPTPLNQLASVSIPDSRTITIQPWDRGAFSDVERAILKSDLGLNPVNDGKLIRINMPPLTEERRRDLAKVAKKYTEDAKIAIRNIRRDANEALKKKKTDKEITEDDMHRGQDEVQKITDGHIARADSILSEKDKEIMEI